jgi:hypothetical protein
MAHFVYFKTPWRELGNTDFLIAVYNDDEKAGELRISKGTLDFRKGKGKKFLKIPWDQVANMFHAYYHS